MCECHHATSVKYDWIQYVNVQIKFSYTLLFFNIKNKIFMRVINLIYNISWT